MSKAWGGGDGPKGGRIGCVGWLAGKAVCGPNQKKKTLSFFPLSLSDNVPLSSLIQPLLLSLHSL